MRTIIVMVAIVGFVVWSHDPIDDTVNFIIGGSIPGTNLALGFWQTVLCIALLLWVIKRMIAKVRLQLLEQTASQIKAEKMKEEFTERHTVTFDPKQRSVIAAPTKSNATS